jgi:hypothetical protein
MFFDDWFGLLRVWWSASRPTPRSCVLLRVSGKRTLAKLNAFDFVVTVALGSTLATVLLSKTWRWRKACSPSRCWPACSTRSPGCPCARRASARW